MALIQPWAWTYAFYRARVRNGSWSNATIDSSVTCNTTPHTIEISQSWWFYIDWTKIWSFSSYTFTETHDLYVFAWNNFRDNVADWMWVVRIYYMKIYENWTLIRDFVPAKRKSDSVVWLIDLVNNQFYTNSWTWTFNYW